MCVEIWVSRPTKNLQLQIPRDDKHLQNSLLAFFAFPLFNFDFSFHAPIKIPSALSPKSFQNINLSLG